MAICGLIAAKDRANRAGITLPEYITMSIFTALALFGLHTPADPPINEYSGAYTRFKNLNAHPRSKSEAIVIKELSRITKREFPTSYTSWLVVNDKQVELDGYNEEMKLAIEVQGPQHTKWRPLEEPYETYLERVETDREKVRLCRENGVNLIVYDLVNMANGKNLLSDYLKSRLKDFGYDYTPRVYVNENIPLPWEAPGSTKLGPSVPASYSPLRSS